MLYQWIEGRPWEKKVHERKGDSGGVHSYHIKREGSQE